MGKYNKEELEKLILIDNLSYVEIGKQRNVSGEAIRKAALRLGVNLPSRRAINKNETFNRGKNSRYCIVCGTRLPHNNKKYCSHKCMTKNVYNEYINNWLNGVESGIKGKDQIPSYIRKYLFDKFNNKCGKCGWDQVHPVTGLIPLQIHHIDGNCLNNKEQNLELLCPNCHSLTNNFGSLNTNSARK